MNDMWRLISGFTAIFMIVIGVVYIVLGNPTNGMLAMVFGVVMLLQLDIDDIKEKLDGKS